MSHSDSEINKSRREFKVQKSNYFKYMNRMGFSHGQLARMRKRIRGLIDTKLLRASCTNNVETVEKQLVKGANPDCADLQGRSSLHIASSRGYTDVVRLLLENGAVPNERDNLGNTPLHLAACNHNIQVVHLLLQAGGDPNQKDYFGKTPLQLVQSKIKLMNKNWKEGSGDMEKLRTDLYLIIDLMLEFVKKLEDAAIDCQMMRLSLDSAKNNNNPVDDQMSALLNEMGAKLTNT